MTKPIDPYSRVYWRVVEDERFASIYGDDHHFAAWVRLLMLADATYPTVAPIPATTRRASVRALSECGLIELLPGGLYRVHGLSAERERRSRADPDRNPTGPAPVPARTNGGATGTLARAGVDETSKDENETRLDETRNAPAEPIIGMSEAEAHLLSDIAKHGAFIRPDSPLGIRLFGLIDRRGIDVVQAEADAIRKGPRLSDRQWVLGLENRLEQIPTNREAVSEHETEMTDTLARRRSEKVWKQREEWFRETGKWDEAWGTKPDAVQGVR